jgi:hypothetical protein
MREAIIAAVLCAACTEPAPDVGRPPLDHCEMRASAVCARYAECDRFGFEPCASALYQTCIDTSFERGPECFDAVFAWTCAELNNPLGALPEECSL